jgi:SAM-dependent methyltransferase
MRTYWDEAARTNAAWYVDTSLDYDSPDMAQFFETGRTVVSVALDDAPAAPARFDTAVEIGSGLGRICAALAARFDHVIGIDISSEMIDRAHELVQDPNVRFVLGDGSGLGVIDDGSADYVLSFTVLQHIPSIAVIESYLQDAGRVLRPGGVFCFQWNNQAGSRWWRARRALLSRLQRTGIRREERGRNAAEFLGSRVPLGHVQRALEAGGLQLSGTRGLGTLYATAWATKPA